MVRGSLRFTKFIPSSALQNEMDSMQNELMVDVVLVAVTGSSSALPANCECVCQYLPHDSAEWRHMDPFLCVDGFG